MKTLLRISGAFLLVAFLSANLLASPARDLEKAAKKKQSAFVLLIDKDSGDISKYKQTIKEAIKQAGHAVMVVVDRSDGKNADLVKRNGLSSMRVPMIVFYQPTGARGVIYPADKVTPELLARLVPSPKKAQMMAARVTK